MNLGLTLAVSVACAEGIPCFRTPRLFPWELRGNLSYRLVVWGKKVSHDSHLQDISARRGFILGQLRPGRVGGLSVATP